MDHLPEQYSIPHYLCDQDLWVVTVGTRTEWGDLDYICAEFAGKGLFYPFHRAADGSSPDHAHAFSEVLQAVLDSPKGFSINGFEASYSQQEQQFLKALQQRLLEALGRD